MVTSLTVGVTAMTYGATAVHGGLPFWLPVLLSVVVLAGSAEFVFVGILASGGNPLAAAFAGLLVNARHLPYGMAVSDVTGSGWRRVVRSHVVNDETVLFTRGEHGPEARDAAFVASAIGISVCWPLGALLGALAGPLLGDPERFGLDATFPAVIASLVLPSLRERRVRAAALAGAVIAVSTIPYLPPGLPVLLALAAVVVAAVRQ